MSKPKTLDVGSKLGLSQSESKSINQSSFITGMTERTPANTQQANTQQFINSSRVLVPSICLYRAFV